MRGGFSLKRVIKSAKRQKALKRETYLKSVIKEKELRQFFDLYSKMNVRKASKKEEHQMAILTLRNLLRSRSHSILRPSFDQILDILEKIKTRTQQRDQYSKVSSIDHQTTRLYAELGSMLGTPKKGAQIFEAFQEMEQALISKANEHYGL